MSYEQKRTEQQIIYAYVCLCVFLFLVLFVLTKYLASFSSLLSSDIMLLDSILSSANTPPTLPNLSPLFTSKY